MNLTIKIIGGVAYIPLGEAADLCVTALNDYIREEMSAKAQQERAIKAQAQQVGGQESLETIARRAMQQKQYEGAIAPSLPGVALGCENNHRQHEPEVGLDHRFSGNVGRGLPIINNAQTPYLGDHEAEDYRGLSR